MVKKLIDHFQTAVKDWLANAMFDFILKCFVLCFEHNTIKLITSSSENWHPSDVNTVILSEYR